MKRCDLTVFYSRNKESSAVKWNKKFYSIHPSIRALDRGPKILLLVFIWEFRSDGSALKQSHGWLAARQTMDLWKQLCGRDGLIWQKTSVRLQNQRCLYQTKIAFIWDYLKPDNFVTNSCFAMAYIPSLEWVKYNFSLHVKERNLYLKCITWMFSFLWMKCTCRPLTL